MDLYDRVKEQWRIWAVHSGKDLDLRLDSFRILLAYNSGRIESATVSYHGTWEIFKNGRMVGYTGDPHTLLKLQNRKICCDPLWEKIPVKEPFSIPPILKIRRALTEGICDERRYLVNGERPGTFKKQDYVTGIHEVGSYPGEVEGDLTKLIGRVNSVDPKAPLKAGTYLHTRLEDIHPFADGGGRVGWTLLSYWLMISDYSPIIIYEEDKKAYYDVFQQYGKQESLDALIRLLETQTVKTWARVMKLFPNDIPKHQEIEFHML